MRKIIIFIFGVMMLLVVGCSSKEVVNLESMTVKEVIDYTANNIFEVDSIDDSLNNTYLVTLNRKILSDKTAVKEILMDTEKILKNLQSKKDIEYINITWQLEITDQYGNTSYKPAFKVGYKRETLDKISWDNMDYNNLDDIADDTWQHPGLN